MQSKEKWNRLASTWVNTGPPASPSDEDISNFSNLLQDALSDKSTGTIMILGCTPKLRDLLCDFKGFKSFDVVCVDFSREMYERTTESVKCHNPREQFVLEDWLTMDIGQQRFDAVLGDKVIDNVMPGDWTTFFERVHYHLRPHGYFIVHLAPQNMTFKHITFSTSLDKWADFYRHYRGSLERAASGFWEEVLGATAFKGGMRHNTQKIERLEDEVEAIRMKLDSLDQYHQDVFNVFLRVFWNSREDEWSSYDYEEILWVMNKYFTHDKTLHSKDYIVASIQPIVRMKAK